MSQLIHTATCAVIAGYGFDALENSRGVVNFPKASRDLYSCCGDMEGYYTEWETSLILTQDSEITWAMIHAYKHYGLIVRAGKPHWKENRL